MWATLGFVTKIKKEEDKMELGQIHIDIAKVLIECAKNKQVISYSELCSLTGYGSPENMGKVLDPLTKFTYDNCNNTFISVLVVRKDTINSKLAKPGIKFFEMYRDFTNDFKISDNDIVLSQREKAYNHDWNNLTDLIRKEINK